MTFRPVRTFRALPAARLAWTALAVAVVAAVAGWLVVSPLSRPTQAAPAAVPAPLAPSPQVTPLASPTHPGVVLTAAARARCPRTATACADLDDHLTWLQSKGHVTYGPVRMEPGRRGHRTPRGSFQVAWKAGPGYISRSYGVPIPYAVFFAAGGIAFHAGPLTSSSHGCIHLTLAAARYYNEHLPIGAGVVVF